MYSRTVAIGEPGSPAHDDPSPGRSSSGGDSKVDARPRAPIEPQATLEQQGNGGESSACPGAVVAYNSEVPAEVRLDALSQGRDEVEEVYNVERDLEALLDFLEQQKSKQAPHFPAVRYDKVLSFMGTT